MVLFKSRVSGSCLAPKKTRMGRPCTVSTKSEQQYQFVFTIDKKRANFQLFSYFGLLDIFRFVLQPPFLSMLANYCKSTYHQLLEHLYTFLVGLPAKHNTPH